MKLPLLQSLFLLLFPLVAVVVIVAQEEDHHEPMDVAWATYSNKLTHNQALYDDFMTKCRQSASSPQICDMTEDDRFQRNRVQPSGMKNYTKLGFEIVKTPPALFQRMQDFYHSHRNKDESVEWPQVVHSYQNPWDAPTSMITISNFDEQLYWDIFDTTEDILQEWTQQRLAPSAFWGVRVYPNNSILTTHVDFPPRVISCIINVDQETDEQWPLTMWGHDGKEYNITLQPGDMALYESHSIIHGRPYPFRGKSFANVFVHFEPLGPLDKPLTDYLTEPVGTIPPYLDPNNQEVMNVWRRAAPRGWQLYFHNLVMGIVQNKYRIVEDLLVHSPQMFSQKTADGNLPIDLAIQNGRDDMVELMIQMKAYGEYTKEEVLAKVVEARGADLVNKVKGHLAEARDEL